MNDGVFLVIALFMSIDFLFFVSIISFAIPLNFYKCPWDKTNEEVMEIYF